MIYLFILLVFTGNYHVILVTRIDDWRMLQKCRKTSFFAMQF